MSDRVEALLAELAAENTELRERVARLETDKHSIQPSPVGSRDDAGPGRTFDRRALLAKLGGAGIAGAGLAIAGGTLAATPAAATTGAMSFGTAMDEGTAGTSLTASGSPTALMVANTGLGKALHGKAAGPSALGVLGENTGSGFGVWASSDSGVALRAVTGVLGSGTAVEGVGTGGIGVDGTSTDNTGVSGTSTNSTGVLGTTSNVDDFGVHGDNLGSGRTEGGGVLGTSRGSIGVYGKTGGVAGVKGTSSFPDGAGVWGVHTGTGAGDGCGVLGHGGDLVGVLGSSDRSAGVSGFGTVGVQASGVNAQLLLVPGGNTGSPPANALVHAKGELYLDSLGDLYVCTAGGSPGTWAKVVYGGASGSGTIHLLSKPIRLYDTRANGAPYPPGPATKLAPSTSSHYDLQVTGTTVGGVSVPAGATGVIGTLSVTATVDPGAGNAGYLTVYATGAPPSPATADLTWFGPNETLSVAVTSSLSTTGQMAIHNGMVGGSSAAHVIFDAKGYIT
jgi:hypothetical protein